MRKSRVRRRRRILYLLTAVLLLMGLLNLERMHGTYSRSAVLMDLKSGRVIAQKAPDELRSPASLTKMMTVLLTIEAEPDLNTLVTVPEDIFPALTAAGASMAGFEPGETVTVQDLLYGAMLPSGAECCETLARQVGGSEENFVALMNEKAEELDMTHTHFMNTTGLTESRHYSTANDLAELLRVALQNDIFREIFTTEQYTSSPTEQHPSGLTFASTLLSQLNGHELKNGEILGGKTGYTSAAGLCLASLARVKGREYILITLGAPGSHQTEPTHIEDAVRIYNRI